MNSNYNSALLNSQPSVGSSKKRSGHQKSQSSIGDNMPPTVARIKKAQTFISRDKYSENRVAFR